MKVAKLISQENTGNKPCYVTISATHTQCCVHLMNLKRRKYNLNKVKRSQSRAKWD